MLKDKKAISKEAKLKQVNKNLFELRKTEKMIDAHLNEVNTWINDVKVEKAAQLKYKKALEVGDEVTMEVKNVETGEEEMNEFPGEGGADEVVENEQIEKEMKKIKSQIESLTAKIKK
jgi:prefoldin subunit 5